MIFTGGNKMVQEKSEVFNNPKSQGESEINLHDIWAVLIKRKWIIVGVFLLSIFLSVMNILFTKPVYESRATIKIGQIRFSEKTSYLEKPLYLSRTLYKEYESGEKNNGGKKWAF